MRHGGSKTVCSLEQKAQNRFKTGYYQSLVHLLTDRYSLENGLKARSNPCPILSNKPVYYQKQTKKKFNLLSHSL